MMKKYVSLLIILFLLSVQSADAQHNSHSAYFNNLVNIENGDFGLIVGTDDENVYFITADQASADEMPDNLNAYFYGADRKYKAVQMRTFSFQRSRLYLYAIKTDRKVNWRKSNYRSYKATSGPLYSFIEDEKQKSNWYSNSTAFERNDRISGQEVQLKTGKQNYFSRGMPVIDNSNSIVGIISEQPGEMNLSPVLMTIDMMDISEKLYASGGCKYFQLIEFGQPANRCETDRMATEKSKEMLTKAKKSNQIYAIALAPSFSVTYNMAPAPNSGEKQPGSYGFALGFNVFTRPDNGRFRIAYKPRITLTWLNLPANLTPNSTIGFQAKEYSWQTYEMPTYLEFIINRNIWGSTYWGLGYAPGYQSSVRYEYSSNAYKGNLVKQSEEAKGFSQKVMAEVGFEGGRTRIDFFAAYHLSPWHTSTKYGIGGAMVDPFQGINNTYWMIGLDVCFRINGKWGLKSVK